MRNRYNQVPHLSRDTVFVTTTQANITNMRAKRSALSKQVITRLQGTDKASIIQTNVKHKLRRRIALERSVKYSLEGLNMFNGANLTLNSDEGQPHRRLVCVKDSYYIYASFPSTYKSRYKQEIKQR